MYHRCMRLLFYEMCQDLFEFLFYGGIGKDEYGDPTTVTYVLDILIPGIVGLITAKMFIPIRTKQIIEKRRKQLTSQFRDT